MQQEYIHIHLSVLFPVYYKSYIELCKKYFLGKASEEIEGIILHLIEKREVSFAFDFVTIAIVQF